MIQRAKNISFLVILASFLIKTQIAGATTFLQLQSTYLGVGWFQYRMQVFHDPFFAEADQMQLTIGFTNQVDQSTSATNWINNLLTNNFSSWSFSSVTPQRPYEVSFKIRSSEISYKLGTNFFGDDALVLMSLYFAGQYPSIAGHPEIYSQNVVGCANMPCLVPCSPQEADNSPTNFVYDLKIVPDVDIKHLIQTNGEIHGVGFTWDSDATFLLQGTFDFKNWTNIAYVWSYPPETVWTTNQTLNSYGRYFRTELVTDGHSSSLSPLIGSKNLAVASSAHVTSCQSSNGNVIVHFSVPSVAPKAAGGSGISYILQALDTHFTVIEQSQPIDSLSFNLFTIFPASSLPNPVFFRVVIAQ